MTAKTGVDYVRNIRSAGLTIYDPIEVGDPGLWIPTAELQIILNNALRGKTIGELPLKTRSKRIKELVCDVLGYPTPKAFKKVQPRFVGQQFDTYVQKRDNVQVWNEELSPTRRYVVFRVSADFRITEVKVILGAELAILDRTGKLTGKYQAICKVGENSSELVAALDTSLLAPSCNEHHEIDSDVSPVAIPENGKLLPIESIFDRLVPLIGSTFVDAGIVQERNRGAELHRRVCAALGYSKYHDNGSFPDVLNQLLEVKLQTSQTIDLGLCLPSSQDKLDIGAMRGGHPRICDVRYAIFYATTDGKEVTLTHLFVVTGEAFFDRFVQCQGKKLSKKLQIRLPKGFFSSEAEGLPD